MAALAERRIIPHEELKARSEQRSERKRVTERGATSPVPEHLRLLEALLFAASAPLDEKTLGARLPEDVDVQGSAARAAGRIRAARRQPRARSATSGRSAPRPTCPGC